MKRILLIFVVFTGIIIFFGGKYSNGIFGTEEPINNVFYMPNNGNQYTDISSDEFNELYGDGDIYIVVILNYQLSEKEISDVINGFVEIDKNSRREAIKALRTEKNNKFVNDNLPGNLDMFVSSYSPFIWINVTDMSFSEIVDITQELNVLDDCQTIIIQEDTLKVTQ